MIISDFIYGLRTHKRNTHLKDLFITQLYKFAVNLLSFWTSTIFWAWYSMYFLLDCSLIFFKNSIATWESDCSSHSQWVSLYCISSWDRPVPTKELSNSNCKNNKRNLRLRPSYFISHFQLMSEKYFLKYKFMRKSFSIFFYIATQTMPMYS